MRGKRAKTLRKVFLKPEDKRYVAVHHANGKITVQLDPKQSRIPYKISKKALKPLSCRDISSINTGEIEGIN